MAYDATRHVTVLFGGTTTAGLSGETWEWDGTQWNERFVAGPSPRSGHAMAFDTVRGVAVLFGGDADSGLNGETWEWNGASWTQRFAAGPSPRSGHAIAYDSARGVSVLFGGATSDLNAETWEWNGVSWSLLTVHGPSARKQAAMSFDAARGATVLFGGLVYPEPMDPLHYSVETWEWDGLNWVRHPTNLCYSCVYNGGRYGHAMSYDTVRNITVLFGGDTWDGPSNQTMELRVAPCRADFNGGGLSVADIFDFLGAWFAGDPHADYNGNGSLSVQDIFAFLSDWFGGC